MQGGVGRRKKSGQRKKADKLEEAQASNPIATAAQSPA